LLLPVTTVDQFSAPFTAVTPELMAGATASTAPICDRMTSAA
jgi:hypothetical protein